MSDSLRIRRFNAVYQVPPGLPVAGRLQDRLDRVLRGRLPDVCGELLTQGGLGRNDLSVWLIRRLDVDLAIDPSACNDAQLARLWAHQIVAALTQSLTQGVGQGEVLHFSDRADYLAQFITDCAAGQAGGKWYYEAFDSLRELPSGTAIAEALVREPEQAPAVVLRLANCRRLERVLDVLGARDARRVYDLCLPETPSAEGARRWIDRTLEIWDDVGLRAAPRSGARLQLYAALRERWPGADVRGMRPAVDGLFALARVAHRAALEALVDRLVAGDVEGVLCLARESGIDVSRRDLIVLPQIAGGERVTRAWVAHLVRTIQPQGTRTNRQTISAHDGGGRAFSSPCGAIFLLLPSLLDLGLGTLIDRAPYSPPADVDAEERTLLLRHLLAVKLFGTQRAAMTDGDLALRLAIGARDAVEPPSLAQVRALAKRTTSAANEACQRDLIAVLVQQGWIEGVCLAGELAAVGDRDVLLLRDVARDTWVYAAPVEDGDYLAALDRALTLFRAACGVAPEGLLLGRRLGEHLNWSYDVPEGKVGRVIWAGSDRRVAREALSEALQDALVWHARTARPPKIDLAYLTLAMPDLHFDLTWSLVARAGMKAFARRLMGFDRSSLPYLYRNFLAGTSLVRLDGERVNVHLPRSPLHVVLRMAGVNGMAYSVPWLAGAHVQLSLESG